MAIEQEQPEDGQLVGRTLSGDRAAFARLYDRYFRRVFTVVSCLFDERSVVDDLVQETFLRAYGKLDRLDPYDNFGNWLVGIARKVAREKRRKLYRDRHRFVGTVPLDSGGSSLPVEELQDELDYVLEQIQQLPELERMAIELFFLEECNAEKTAELLGMSRSGIYALLKRACRNVAQSIENRSPVGE